jgi:hypothetical protein
LSYKDQVVKIPVAPTGPLLPKVVNLCDSDDSDSLDASDGDEVGEDFGPNKMLLPIGFPLWTTTRRRREGARAKSAFAVKGRKVTMEHACASAAMTSARGVGALRVGAVCSTVSSCSC